MNGYNGWTNYETWVMNMFMGDYRYYRELKDEIKGDDDEWKALTEDEKNDKIHELKDRLEAEQDTLMDEFVSDKIPMHFIEFLNASLKEVNWYELAKNMLEE